MPYKQSVVTANYGERMFRLLKKSPPKQPTIGDIPLVAFLMQCNAVREYGHAIGPNAEYHRSVADELHRIAVRLGWRDV